VDSGPPQLIGAPAGDVRERGVQGRREESTMKVENNSIGGANRVYMSHDKRGGVLCHVLVHTAMNPACVKMNSTVWRVLQTLFGIPMISVRNAVRDHTSVATVRRAAARANYPMTMIESNR
jgi:hypothetical protein